MNENKSQKNNELHDMVKLASNIRYIRFVLNRALQYFNVHLDVHTIEDWLQDCSIQLLGAVDAYDPEIARPTTYAWHVIWNFTRNAIRQQRRRLLCRTEVTPNSIDANDPFIDLAVREQQEKVLSTISKLQPRHAQILLLELEKRRSDEAIAWHIGINLASYSGDPSLAKYLDMTHSQYRTARAHAFREFRTVWRGHDQFVRAEQEPLD